MRACCPIELQRRRAATTTDGVWSFAGFVFYVLCCGGIALAYLAQWISLTWSGLLQTPTHPWNISLQGEGTIQLLSADFQTLVPASSVEKFTHVYDDNWDQMNGMEDSGLIIHLRGGGRIKVPGSSTGFEEVLAALKSQHEIRVLPVS